MLLGIDNIILEFYQKREEILMKPLLQPQDPILVELANCTNCSPHIGIAISYCF